MARTQTRYVCASCGEAFLRWAGQCRACGEWNTLVETLERVSVRTAQGGHPRTGGSPAERRAPVPLAAAGGQAPDRIAVGIGELDRVLGGGLVPGSLVLVGGEPGIGKSTLLLQAAAGVAVGPAGERGVLYASGEGAAAQIHLRAARLGLTDGPAGERVRVVGEPDVDRIVEHGRSARPALVVVDSIQTVAVGELGGPPGSVGQVREAAGRLAGLAKDEGVCVVLVGHVTKDGSLAGPKTLEHLVDAVLALEGDRYGQLRVLRAAKNRFGSTDEVGVFEIGPRGLVEVADPSRAFLADHPGPASGRVVAPVLEGTRPLLVEVQALVAPAGPVPPRRTTSGIDPARLALLVAVLGRRAGLGLGSHDVYANVAGGLTVGEPALDLPVALAIASAARDRPVGDEIVAIGEIGLLGELRPVPGLERRLREAARLGFRRALVPPERGRRVRVDGLRIEPIATLRDGIEAALGPVRPRHGG